MAHIFDIDHAVVGTYQQGRRVSARTTELLDTQNDRLMLVDFVALIRFMLLRLTQLSTEIGSDRHACLSSLKSLRYKATCWPTQRTS
jgi:hypothetical protein